MPAIDCKQNVYEYDSVRVPLIIAGPGRQMPAMGAVETQINLSGSQKFGTRSACRIPLFERPERGRISATRLGCMSRIRFLQRVFGLFWSSISNSRCRQLCLLPLLRRGRHVGTDEIP